MLLKNEAGIGHLQALQWKFGAKRIERDSNQRENRRIGEFLRFTANTLFSIFLDRKN